MRSSSCRWSCARRWFVAAMRLRASSSSNSAARTGAATTNVNSSTSAKARIIGLFANVDDLHAAVLRPRRLVVAERGRLLLAERHGLDLHLGRAEELHHLLHRVGALLAKRDVVLAAA